MTEQLDGPPEGSLGLADFLTQLRVELDQAHLRAASDGLGLRLGVDQVELSLDVVYTTEKAGQANAEVKAKFWVLEFASAGVGGSLRAENTRTQHLNILLRPRQDTIVLDEMGQPRIVTGGLDVSGKLEQSEGQVVLPVPPAQSAQD